MMDLGENELLACCGSSQFAKEVAKLSPFSAMDAAVSAARDIWFNKVDVNGWLQAFSAHPQIGDSPLPTNDSTSAQWSKGEQSTALATSTTSSLQELAKWNARYRQKFGFVFLICASGRSTSEILEELKIRFSNRPIVEFEIAAKEQMKITELRLAKLFSTKAKSGSESGQLTCVAAKKAEEDRVSIIGSHLTSEPSASAGKAPQISRRTRPPITTHVLDVSRGSPASGIEVHLEVWNGSSLQLKPAFRQEDANGWSLLGASTTDKDGRSGQLMDMVDALSPGTYKISFNTGKYCPDGFFPYVSIVFEIRESQKWDHFHVPLLLSPFSFSTYRGS